MNEIRTGHTNVMTKENWLKAQGVEMTEIGYGTRAEIDSWMRLVQKVSGSFLGLETEEALCAHRQTVLDFMDRQEAICAKKNDEIVGLLLFSEKNNMLCFLAVDPAYRRACMRNGGNCIHNDDMRALLEEILESDLLLFSFPLYCYGMPAPLKALIDRTLPLSSMAMRKAGERYEHVEQADFSHLKYLMICGCGLPNSRHNFEPAVAQFKLCFPNQHTILIVPESPMFNAPEAESVTKPRLELIRRAGRQYAQNGEIDLALMAEITSPMIPEEVYAKIASGEM